MARERITEQLIIQENNKPDTSVGLGTKITKVYIRCNSDSSNDTYVGWNNNASNANTLQPTESVAYEAQHGNFLDGNDLYISFNGDASGGRALVTVHNQIDEDCPN